MNVCVDSNEEETDFTVGVFVTLLSGLTVAFR